MATGFYEIEFPRDISYGSTFGPTFSTDVVTMRNGSEQRNINWTYQRCSGDLSTGIRKEADFNRFYNFWMLMRGKAFGFRYYDWGDHEGQYMLLGIGDGSTTKFQLMKNYIDDVMDIMYQRKISKPITDTVKVFTYDASALTLNDIALQRKIKAEFTATAPTALKGVTVDTTTGIITLGTAPAAKIAVVASFDFDVPVRFDTDSMSRNYQAYKAHQWTDIPIIELKV